MYSMHTGHSRFLRMLFSKSSGLTSVRSGLVEPEMKIEIVRELYYILHSQGSSFIS
jgi:hypothetical protein